MDSRLPGDPAYRRGLAILAGAGTADRQLCPRCARRWIPTAGQACRSCADGGARQPSQPANGRHTGRASPKLERAKQWLRTQLRRGPVESGHVKAKAAEAGISPATLRRAMEALAVDVERRGRRGQQRSWWSL